MGEYRNLFKALQEAFGFFLVFVSFNSAANLQSRLMSELGFGNLGFYNLASLYICVVIGALFSTSIVAKSGYRLSHLFGSLGIIIWILVSILPACKKDYADSDLFIFKDAFIYPIMIVSSCLCGLSCGIIWTAQGNYTTECSTESTKGFYFSLFWTMYMFSQVVGNSIAAFVLGSLSEAYFFIIMTIIASASLPIFLTLRNPIQELDDPDINRSYTQEDSQHPIDMVKQVIMCMFSKRMLFLLPQCAWTGISLAFYSGMLVYIISSTLDGDPDLTSSDVYQQSMIAMIVFGIGEMTGGPFIGRIVDKYNSRVACKVNVIIVVILADVTIIYLFLFKFNFLAYVMTFLWGFQDASINTHCYGMLGFEFISNSDPFAVYNILQSLFCFIFQIIQAYVNGQVAFLEYTVGVGLLGSFCVGTTYFFKFRRKGTLNDNSFMSTSINYSINSVNVSFSKK